VLPYSSNLRLPMSQPFLQSDECATLNGADC
jgi:hypothetical protein